MREVLDKDKGNERPKYMPVDDKNAERKMFENIEDGVAFRNSTGKVKGPGIEKPSGSRIHDLQFIAEFLPHHLQRY